MLLEPHKIEDKFFGRFLKNSFKLFLKNPISWSVFIFLSFLISAAFSSIPFPEQVAIIPIFLKILIGIWTLFLGFEFAANTDYNTFSLTRIFQYFKISLKHSIQFIKDNFMYIMFLLVIISVLHLIFSSVDKPEPKNPEAYRAYFDYFFNMTSIMFWGFILALHRSRVFYYPIMRQFYMNDPELAYRLSEKSLDINPPLKAFMHFAYPILIIMMPIYTLLIGTPFFIPFIPLILYVAFKEIFLNKEEVHVSEHNLKPAHISNQP